MNPQLSSTGPAIAAGLTMAQVIGSFQVGWGNRLLAHRMDAVAGAGYFSVPTDRVMPGLQSVSAAIGGGLFFTLTIGAFFSIITVGWLRLWTQGLNKPKTGVGLFALFIAIVVGAISYYEFDFFLAAYILFVPFSACLLYPWDDARIRTRRQGAVIGKNNRIYAKCRTKWQRNTFLFYAFWLLLPLIILVLMGRSFLGPRVFFDIRDRILLSNPAGRLVNDFYYRYTLYPAESFKSLEQKQVRAFRWVGPDAGGDKKKIIAALVANDYLPMSIGGDPDMRIASIDENTLSFAAGNQTVQIAVPEFLDDSHKVLKEISGAADNHRFLRQLTFISLVAGFPLLIYLMAHGLTRWMASRLFSIRVGSVITSIACLLVGMAILWLLTSGRPGNISVNTLPEFVNATDRRHRVEALKMMEKKRIDPSQFNGYTEFLKSPRMIERYWIARALAHGRGEKIDSDLNRMLKDPSPNVVCMALKSFGKRGGRQMIPPVLALMKKSDHWYVQWHAYNALKRLGWRQHVSD